MVEVRVSSEIVKALIKWNGLGYESAKHFDKKFIKALLVSFIGIINICNDDMPGSVINLVRGNLLCPQTVVFILLD